MKTLLITGANGFIGKNACEYFKCKYNILAPTHTELDLLSDTAVCAYLKESDIDYIIHCANIGGTKGKQYKNIVESNTRMFFNLTTAGGFNQMINMGSGAEYDKSRNLCKVRETDFGYHIPKDEYGYSKYLMSMSIESEFCTTLRPFGVFGKYEDYNYRFISNAIIKNLIGEPITIKQNVVFDWLYVKDLMKMIDCIIGKHLPRHAYNVTPTISTDLITIAKIINDNSEKPSEIIVENEGLNYEYTGSNHRFMLEYPNFKFTPIEKAIPVMITYYKKLLPKIDINIIKQDSYSNRCNVRE